MSDTRLRIQTDLEKSTTGGSLVVTDVSTKEPKYLAPSSNGDILRLNSGVPQWFTPSYLTGNQAITLTGDVTGSGTTSIATTLATVNASVGSYGDQANVPTFTVNAKGLITSVSNSGIVISESQVTNLLTDLAGKQATVSLTTTGTSGAATFNSGTGVLNIPNYATGGGLSGLTTNTIPKATSSTTIGNSLLIDNGTTLTYTSPVTTGVTTAAGTALLYNSLTTGTGLHLESSTLSTGSILNIVTTSSAADAGQSGVKVSVSGTQVIGSTTYAGYFYNNHSGASGNMVGVYGQGHGSAGTNQPIGVSGLGTGTATGTPIGVKGVATATGANNSSYGGYFTATSSNSNSTGVFVQGGTYGLVVAGGKSGFGTQTPTAFVEIVDAATTAGNVGVITANGLSSGNALSITSTSTAAASNTQTGLNVSLSGTNATTTQTTFGGKISNTHAGTLSTNVGLQLTASGGTSANIALQTTSGRLDFTDALTTTGNLTNITGNNVSSGNLVSINSTSTAAASNTQTGLNVALSGANATSTQTTYGAQIINTHTGTSSKNVALYLASFGGTTNASLLTKGQVGFETTTVDPSSIFDVASSDRGSRPIPTVLNTNMLAISSPATGLLVYNATHNSIFIYNGSYWERVTKGGVSNVPTISLGTGAGTGAIASINGDAECGYISISTGSSPVPSSVIFTLTTANSYAYPLSLMLYLTPGNDVAAELSGKFQVYTTPMSGSQSRVVSGSSALAAGSTYVWNYVIKGF